MTSHYCHHDQRRDRCTDRNYDTLTVALPCLNCFPHTLTVGLPHRNEIPHALAFRMRSTANPSDASC